MPLRLPAFAMPRAVSWQGDRQEAVRLALYRVYCVIVGVLVPVFWLVYQVTDPGAYDPLWMRLGLTGVCLVLLGLSYASRVVQQNLYRLVHALFYVLTVWFVGLAARNAFSPDYAVGLLFVFAAISIAFNGGLQRTGPLTVYLAFSLATASVALALVPGASVGRLLFGGCLAAMAVVIWITAHSRVRLQASLAASERTYRRLFASAGDALLIVEPGSRRILEANAAASALYGYTGAELRGLRLADLSDAPETANVEAAGSAPVEAVHRRRDGARRHVVVGTTQIDLDGVAAWLCSVRDVTAQFEAEREVKRLKAFYEQVLDDLPSDVAVLDPEGRFVYLNSKCVADPELRAWLVGRTGADYCQARGLDPSIAERRQAELRRAVEERRIVQFEETIRNSRGELRHILRSASPVVGPGGAVTHLIGYGLDLTEREQARRALKESEKQYRALFDASGDGIVILDGDRLTHCNERACALFGYTRDELLAASPYDLSPERQPDGSCSKARVLEHVAAAMGGATQRFEWRHRRRDGSPFDAEVTLNRIDLGEQVLLQAIVRDVTARKRYEQGLIEARDRAEELLRLKTTLLHNMSHELRTPLTAILGFAELLAGEVEGDAACFVSMINAGGQRLLDTLNSVLDLAHLEAGTFELRPEPVDVGAAVGETARLLLPLADRKAIDLRVDVPPARTEVLADRAALTRILSNLVSNAIKFTDAGHVACRVETDDEGVRVAVEDTGVGISPAFLPHLFDEFRQESSGLARRHEGSGLGLTITKRLVDLLGGTLHVASTKHAGSTFTVMLPWPGGHGNPKS